MTLNEKASVEMEEMRIDTGKLVDEKYWFDKERKEKSLLNTYYYADPSNASSTWRSGEETPLSQIKIEIQSDDIKPNQL